MTVNPFWLGVLMTIVGVIVFFIVAAFIHVKRQEAGQEYQEDMLMDEAAFKKMLSEAVRDALRENMFGGAVEDPEYDKDN